MLRERRPRRCVDRHNEHADSFIITQKKHGGTDYDLNDPFIDDSDLAVDERRFFGQTKQQGFYVSSGEVALVKDKYDFSPCPRTSL